MTLRMYWKFIFLLPFYFGMVSSFAKAQKTPSEETPNDNLLKIPGDIELSTAEGPVPFPALSRIVLGEVSKPVVFDWRRASLGWGLDLGQPIELNNFQSKRIAIKSYYPSDSSIFGIGINWVKVTSTRSSLEVGKTPYRQKGRLTRFELEFSGFVPLFEAVTTPIWNWIPDTEFAFGPAGDLRFLHYPGMWKKANIGQVLKSLVAPKLSSREKELLASKRHSGMLLDDNKLDLLLGLQTFVFFSSGVFIQTSLKWSIPYSFFKSDLGTWWDVSAGVGYAF
jgi:hypothetical protein